MEALKRAERQKRHIASGSGDAVLEEESASLPIDLADASSLPLKEASRDDPLPDLKWVEPVPDTHDAKPEERPPEDPLALEPWARAPAAMVSEDPPDLSAIPDFLDEVPPQRSEPAIQTAVAEETPTPEPAKTRQEEPAPVPENLTLDQRRQQAANVFSAARQRPQRNQLMAALGATTVLALLGGGAYLYWLYGETSPMPQRGLPHVPVIATPSIAPSPSAPPSATAQEVLSPAMPDAEMASPAETGSDGDATKITEAPRRAVSPVAEPVRETHAINIRPGSQKESITPALSRAYSAFMAGNDNLAHQDYSIALRQDGNNRDALLGMAAIATKRGQIDIAVGIYQRLLELDPRDTAAQSGMLALNVGQSDPVQSESRIKSLLAQQPDVHFLYFTLGNLYASQSRWAEAQQAFFNAHQRESGNPDYLYNLAISLEHLSQQKLALEFYQRALARSRTTPANFDKASAQSRIKELQPTAGN